jgi:hypothetical protein
MHVDCTVSDYDCATPLPTTEDGDFLGLERSGDGFDPVACTYDGFRVFPICRSSAPEPSEPTTDAMQAMFRALERAKAQAASESGQAAAPTHCCAPLSVDATPPQHAPRRTRDLSDGSAIRGCDHSPACLIVLPPRFDEHGNGGRVGAKPSATLPRRSIAPRLQCGPRAKSTVRPVFGRFQI